MDFIFGDAVILGTCTSVSESGLRGTLSASVTPGTEGLLTLYKNIHSVQIPGSVDSIDGQEACIQFKLSSEADRISLRDFMKILGPFTP